MVSGAEWPFNTDKWRTLRLRGSVMRVQSMERQGFAPPREELAEVREAVVRWLADRSKL